MNYYIDPSTEKQPGKGTLQEPFFSAESVHAIMNQLKPGDTVFFRKGQIYDQKLIIRCSGTPRMPIVFTGYGSETNHPVFIYRKQGEGSHYMFELRKANHVVISGIDVSDDNLQILDASALSRIKIAFALESANYNRIENCKVSWVGIGVNILGDHNMVSRCQFHNLRMVRNTKDIEDDDYGANPVVIAGSYNVISECKMLNGWAHSYDYEFDGGAVEFFGPNCSNNTLSRNFAMNCNGFIEFGSDQGGLAQNNHVLENLVVDCGSFLYINNRGKFALSVENLLIQHNYIIQSVEQFTRPKQMISLTQPSTTQNIVINLDNNMFWLNTPVNLIRNNILTESQWVHRNNHYFLQGGQLNMVPGKTEHLFTVEQWRKKMKDDKSFSQFPGLYPYKNLIPYWNMLF